MVVFAWPDTVVSDPIGPTSTNVAASQPGVSHQNRALCQVTRIGITTRCFTQWVV